MMQSEQHDVAVKQNSDIRRAISRRNQRGSSWLSYYTKLNFMSPHYVEVLLQRGKKPDDRLLRSGKYSPGK